MLLVPFKGPQVHAVPRRRNALARRVRAGRVHPRANAELALLADVPILAVGAIPEFFRIGDVVPRSARRVRMHHPFADHARMIRGDRPDRSEEHTSELQSHSFISYAVFCLKKKTKKTH